MTRFLLIRHGNVEGIVPERFRGRTDVPLSGLGRRQAAATAKRLASGWKFRCVYTSPLRRCVETGAEIADRAGSVTAVLPSLNDLDYGAWRWKTMDEARELDADLYARWLREPDRVRFPGGESLTELSARASASLAHLTGRHPSETVVVVAHDAVNRAMLLRLLGLTMASYRLISQSPCGISEAETLEDRIHIVRVNETAHVEGLK